MHDICTQFNMDAAKILTRNSNSAIKSVWIVPIDCSWMNGDDKIKYIIHENTVWVRNTTNHPYDNIVMVGMV